MITPDMPSIDRSTHLVTREDGNVRPARHAICTEATAHKYITRGAQRPELFTTRIARKVRMEAGQRYLHLAAHNEVQKDDWPVLPANHNRSKEKQQKRDV